MIFLNYGRPLLVATHFSITSSQAIYDQVKWVYANIYRNLSLNNSSREFRKKLLHTAVILKNSIFYILKENK